MIQTSPLPKSRRQGLIGLEWAQRMERRLVVQRLTLNGGSSERRWRGPASVGQRDIGFWQSASRLSRWLVLAHRQTASLHLVVHAGHRCRRCN